MDPLARRGAVFVVSVLLALIGGYFIGKTSASPSSPSVPTHSHADASFSLAVSSPAFSVGSSQDLRFRVLGPSGSVVTDFAVKHDKRMHLIVVRSDLTGYQHLHPDLAPDGAWSVPLTLASPGTWRAFADFATVNGDGQLTDATASAFLTVPGAFSPAALPAPSASASVSGVSVSVGGAARAGGTEPLTLVSSSGPLERYLGAYGHLVLVRSDDLAFVHVHPEDALSSDGRQVRFWVTVPGPGMYRAFFDFSINGVVRTAEFTLSV
jgi:hypothetical protein